MLHLAGQDWTHFNQDEIEGHDPAFIGRPNLKHDRLDKGGILAPSGDNNPIFNQDMLILLKELMNPGSVIIGETTFQSQGEKMDLQSLHNK